VKKGEDCTRRKIVTGNKAELLPKASETKNQENEGGICNRGGKTRKQGDENKGGSTVIKRAAKNFATEGSEK